MVKLTELRKFALLCAELAHNCSNQVVAEQLIELSKLKMRLASQLERLQQILERALKEQPNR